MSHKTPITTVNHKNANAKTVRVCAAFGGFSVFGPRSREHTTHHGHHHTTRPKHNTSIYIYMRRKESHIIGSKSEIKFGKHKPVVVVVVVVVGAPAPAKKPTGRKTHAHKPK